MDEDLERELEARGLQEDTGVTRRNMICLFAALTVGSLMYRLITRHHLEQTSLLFIGIPAVMGCMLAMAPPAKTITGGIVRGITFMLLLSGPLLGEGFICVVMASPVFLIVGVLVGAIIEWSKRGERSSTIRCFALLALIPMCLEGTSPRMSFDRGERVAASAVVSGSEQEVRERMGTSPRLDLNLPAYLRMGFPRPRWAAGQGLAIGDTRTIHFDGGEGMPGDLVMRVSAVAPQSVRFEVARDECDGMHSVGHWVKLETSEVSWQAVDAKHTRVTWALAYERRLDPAWYFGPWERYGVGLAARYLIDANAGPR